MLLDLSGINLVSLDNNSLVLNELAKNNLCFEDVTELNVSDCGLEDLFGIDLFKNLKTLVASNNNISLLDPLVSLNLKVIKLDHNNLQELYIKQLNNGMVVLSSDPDNEYTESFLNFGAKVETEQTNTYEFDIVDLSHNNIQFVKNIVYDKGLNVKVLKLSNNNISDFSGLESVSNISVLDVSFNEEIDLKDIGNLTLEGKCKINLQGTNLINEHMLSQLLNTYENMVVHHETDHLHHERLKSPYNLHLNRLKNKKFTRGNGEFADFVYEGEVSPSELLTPRHFELKKQTKTIQSREKQTNLILQMETQSTTDNNDDKSSLTNNTEMGVEYNYDEYQQIPDIETHTFGINKHLDYISSPRELDFLISSMELCKKIDIWSDDIKNTLYNNIID